MSPHRETGGTGGEDGCKDDVTWKPTSTFTFTGALHSQLCGFALNNHSSHSHILAQRLNVQEKKISFIFSSFVKINVRWQNEVNWGSCLVPRRMSQLGDHKRGACVCVCVGAIGRGSLVGRRNMLPFGDVYDIWQATSDVIISLMHTHLLYFCLEVFLRLLLVFMYKEEESVSTPRTPSE